MRRAKFFKFYALPGLLVLFVCEGAAFAKETIPFFVVEGSVSRELFLPHQAAPYHKSEARVTFYYTNHSWQIELNYLAPKQRTPSVQNCMRIPDGTRTYTLFEGDDGAGLPSAWLCPLAYPIPGMTLLFDSWLSLCPNPELPLLGPKRIRRFLQVPTCRLSLINHAQNEGAFIARYLSPEGNFLSELIVWNNGINIDIGGDNNDSVTPFPDPLRSGFIELHYKVIESTNVNGLVFPLNTVLKQYDPSPGASTTNDIFISTLTQLAVDRVSILQNDILRRPVPPAKLFASDYRPKSLKQNDTVDYLNSSDQWKSASDPSIMRLVQKNRPVDARPIFPWIMVVLFLTILAPALFLLRKVKPQPDDK